MMKYKHVSEAVPLLILAALCALAALFPELHIPLSRDALFVGWCIFITGAWLIRLIEERTKDKGKDDAQSR
jgi:hypothetical protein